MTYYYMEYHFSLPKPPEGSERWRAYGLLIDQFCNSVARRYGGSTKWAPTMEGLAGTWRNGWRIDEDEIHPIWVLVELSKVEQAERDFEMWKGAFEQGLGEKLILVTWHLVQTFEHLHTRARRSHQLSLFGRRARQAGAA